MLQRLTDETGGGFDARGVARAGEHSKARASLGERLVAAGRAAAAAHLAEQARRSLRDPVEPPRYRPAESARARPESAEVER